LRSAIVLAVASLLLLAQSARAQVGPTRSEGTLEPAGASAEPTSTARGVVVTGAATSSEGDKLRYPPSSVRAPLVIGGLAFTLVAYGGAAGMAAAFGDAEVPGADSLYVPLVGPFVALGRIGCSPNESDSCGELNALRGVLYVLDGLAQLGGLGIAAEGLFATTEATGTPGRAGLELTPVPIVNAEVRGIGLVGRF
jgi:hypothetical protein